MSGATGLTAGRVIVPAPGSYCSFDDDSRGYVHVTAEQWLARGLLLACAGMTACSGGTTPVVEPVQWVVDFQDGPQAAGTGFADYPAGEEGFYELDAGWETIPDGDGRSGIYLNGNNHSDDLFMFWQVPVTGLASGARYAVSFAIELATNAGEGCVGIGGAPGESVYLKAGLTTVEPQAIDPGDGFLQMNVDKGQQSNSGADAVVVGNLAGRQTTCSGNNPYETKQVATDEVFTFAAGPEGEAWLLVGTDSGFEGTTRVYYSRVVLQLSPV